MKPKKIEKILIVDFGSQFTQLVARKIRELGVYSEIVNSKKLSKLKDYKTIKGIILSGGPLTVTTNKGIKLNEIIIKTKLPVLGICYGHQILAKRFGGKIKISKKREFGRAIISKKK